MNNPDFNFMIFNMNTFNRFPSISYCFSKLNGRTMEKSLKLEVSQTSEISVYELNMNPKMSHKTAPSLNPRLQDCILTAYPQ